MAVVPNLFDEGLRKIFFSHVQDASNYYVDKDHWYIIDGVSYQQKSEPVWGTTFAEETKTV